ncbi:ABC transporter ATP-binding protein [Pendulispora rubella]|uniref:ABC transporter ATP-binding protein n=1 Tax=Pendulispora rubella TaxID=2741070 RepID=A0ABZ2LHQ4_9BACT
MSHSHDLPLLELRNVTKVYGERDAEVRALDGVSFAMQHGEFVAVVGASGSGKSTAMNIIGALDTPTSGAYFVRGIDVTALDTDALARLRRHCIGFVFQGFNLLPRTTALENVELPLVYRRVPRSHRRELAREALHAVGLEGREHHKPNELSGGQQQRVAIARAIVTNPLLVVADEPTGNLDSARKGEIMRLLAGLNRTRGMSVVMVTHEPDVARWARRIIRFHDGMVAEDAPNTPEES